MPGGTFLPQAGPIGTAIGISLGALMMMILAVNYHHLMNKYPDNGGTYAYTKRIFGYDHGFLNAWFLGLMYIAILWANASALPLIARILLGNTFQFGFSYDIAGYHIYCGEILLATVALVLAAFLCMRRSLAVKAQIVMALVLVAGVAICFFAALTRHDSSQPLFDPAFASDERAVQGTFTILAIAPWAFSGFESVAHSAE
jgi:amino acid transporter